MKETAREKREKKWRYVLMSLFILLLCLAIVVGASLSVLTGSVTLTVHLQSGSIGGLSLTRTSLTSRVLTDEGYLETTTDSTEKSFTEASQDNIFGIAEDDYIVPCCYYEAEMRLTNQSNVAVGYWLALVFEGDANALAEQLYLTVTAGETVFQDFIGGYYAAGSLAVGGENDVLASVPVGSSAQFTVKIQFDDNTENNAAQNQNVSFDLVVYAVQLTSEAASLF